VAFSLKLGQMPSYHNNKTVKQSVRACWGCVNQQNKKMMKPSLSVIPLRINALNLHNERQPNIKNKKFLTFSSLEVVFNYFQFSKQKQCTIAKAIRPSSLCSHRKLSIRMTLAIN
jgi:hypothetical protein